MTRKASISPATSPRDTVLRLYRQGGAWFLEIHLPLEVMKRYAKPSPRKEKPALLTVGAVASVLNVHPNTIRRWSASGILKELRVGPRRDRRYSRAEVESMARLKRRSRKARKES